VTTSLVFRRRAISYTGLVGVCAVSALAFVTPAHAGGCNIVGTVGNIQFFTASADNQCEDGDDVKLFIDKSKLGPFTTVDGSLNGNDNTLNNIVTSADGDFDTDGSGFANFKSVDAGSTSNTLTAFTFTKGTATTMANGQPFPGFDGELFRGQIDDTDKYNGDITVTITVTVAGVTTTLDPFVFSGIKAKKDFGVLGFDEISDPAGYTIDSVVVTAGTNGAFNELKQLAFSVPGATAIPEPSSWAMLVLGFMGLGYAAFRRSGKQGVSAFG
jgi:PEP-CTERM motif